MDKLGIEFISVFGLPPAPFVELTADLGCRNLSLGLQPLDCNPHDYPSYSLSDPALQREFKAALRDRGVAFALAEGFFVLPGRDVGDYAADLDLICELGAQRINSLGLEPDRGRCFDQFAALAELAGRRGLATTLEFLPASTVGDLSTAAAVAKHVGRLDFGVLVDTMHLVRSGGTAADVAAQPPGVITYAQLCDCPLISPYATYAEEAKYERLPPGEGEFPLLDILKALPRDLVIGLEVPQRRLAEAGVGPHERLGRCVEAAGALLAQRGA